MENIYLKNQVAEIEIKYKNKIKPSQMVKITSCDDVFKLCTELFSDNIEYREQFIIILLNKANKVLGFVNISVGGIDGTFADPRIIFQACLKANASGLISIHNHPSGNLTPSQTDINLAKKVKEAGKLLDIQLIDNVIISSEGYYSFANEGII